MPFDMKLAKKFFFDRPAVQEALDRGTHAALSKLGAYVRQRARTSIRKVKGRGISPPGKPPLSHEGSLRRLIIFAFDPSRKSVVIGPTPFKKGEAPELLEYGGTVTRKTPTGIRTFHYRPRPYMRPALAAEVPKWKQYFKEVLRKSG